MAESPSAPLYTVQHCVDTDYTPGLTAAQVVELIWRHDGGNFYIQPRMETAHDDAGNETSETQSKDACGLIWNVFIKDHINAPYRTGYLACYGSTEAEAIEDLLTSAFQRRAWDTSKWMVMEDSKFQNLVRSESIKNEISDFVFGQITNQQSDQVALLAYQINQAITKFKADGGENHKAFSVDATWESGEFTARASFSEDTNMTVMYYENTDNSTADSLYNQSNPEELARIAGLMLSEGWVAGWHE